MEERGRDRRLVRVLFALGADGGYGGEDFCQLLQAGQVTTGQEVVHVDQRSSHATLDRFVAAGPQERIQPDKAMGRALQPGHLASEHLAVAVVPAIADQQNDGATPQDAAGPPVVERPDRFANPSAARPVRHGVAQLVQRFVDVSMAQMVGNAGQACAEHEGLDFHSGEPMGQGMDEVQQHARVWLHRTTDVAQNHQRSLAQDAGAVRQGQQLAAVAQIIAHHVPQIEPAVPAPAITPRAALSHPPLEGSHGPPGGLRFLPRHLAEVLLANQLNRAVEPDLLVRRGHLILITGCRTDFIPALRHAGTRWMHMMLVGETRPFSPFLRRPRGQFRLDPAPKNRKRLVEDGQVFTPRYEERLGGMVEVVPFGAPTRIRARV